MLAGMRRALVVALALLAGCQVEEEPDPSGPARCIDCEEHPSCPDHQPSENPLVACDELDATCFYCGPVMRRYVCQAASNGELRWLDAGEADMCPPPPDDATTGTSG